MLSVFTKMNSGIEERHHGPSDALTTLPNHSSFSKKIFISFVTEINTTSIDFLTPSRSSQNQRYKRRCCSLTPAESDSLSHAHTQATEIYYKHKDSRIKKAQELNTKTSANSNTQDLPKDIKIIKTKIVKGDC
ncbi:hypothetical protein Tco_1456328 [Tanacetum coccineum]